MLEYILWVVVVASVVTSIIRACNIGFQKETYIISVLTHIPLIYKSYTLGSTQMMVLEMFYLLIAVFGIYRWSKSKPQKSQIKSLKETCLDKVKKVE